MTPSPTLHSRVPAGLALLVAGLAAGVSGCARTVELARGPQAHYQTGVPLQDTSEELERMFESVVRISVSAFYDTYVFADDAAPAEAELSDPATLARAADTLSISRTRGATAVLVSAAGRNIALVTARHAVHFPDTVLQYRGSQRERAVAQPETRRVRSVSVKRSQSNWIVGLPDVGTFEVLASDEPSDVAIIGSRVPEGALPAAAVPLRAAVGSPGRLSWGSFVYVLGYPSGYPMVTRGIVSRSYGEDDSFVVDGLWNEGISGGPVLAVRGDDGALEWVGIARAASADVEHRLVPPEGAAEEHDPDVPYRGPIYLEEVRRIQYGIMLSVPVTAIRRLADAHREALRERGYELPRL